MTRTLPKIFVRFRTKRDVYIVFWYDDHRCSGIFQRYLKQSTDLAKLRALIDTERAAEVDHGI